MRYKFISLEAFCDRKSFYNKCEVVETESAYHLKSYDTIVCSMSKDGEFIRIWNGYSVTTMRHINAFMRFLGHPKLGGKKWWESLPVSVSVKL